MKQLVVTSLMTFVVLLGSVGEGVALPSCPSDRHASTWSYCFGTYVSASGNRYVGEFRNGKYHGKATLTYANGDKYVGEFRGGTYHGQGNYYYFAYNRFKGDKYVGEYRNGKKNGQGTYTYANGGKYVGEFRNGNTNGQGTRTYSNGNKYVGEYRNGKKNGQGTYTYANGDKYVGEFRDGKQHGQGTLTFVSGNKYVGKWRDNKRYGQGTFTFENGGKYVGAFWNNKFQGQGTYTYGPSSKFAGDKYVGEYRDANKHGQGTYTFANGQKKEGIWKDNKFQYAKRPSPKKSTPPKSGSTGSGFFVSKLGHIITNAHVVRNCGSITVGDTAKKQVATILLETDKRNDLALLKISNTQMASVETKSLIRKLGLKLVPTASEGLLRSDDVELGEDVLVSGYPYGEIYSDTIKVTKGIVSANKGIGDDTGQFQIDAAVQPGNSGGPIYDENGNIVGVVVAQLNKFKFAKAIGSLPENVNFGIKASTVRQFLTSSGLPTKWSNRSKSMNTKKLAQIAKNQTVMVKCNP
jgi:S1-C subfamily serine protease